MHDGCRNIAVEAGWRLKALLRTRRFHSSAALVPLYKSQILSFIESRTIGIHHAAPSALKCIDRIQERFLRAIGISSQETIVEYRLAPLSCRRVVAILGFSYRIAHGLAPQCLCDLFPKAAVRRVCSSTRGSGVRHDLQLKEMIALEGAHRCVSPLCFRFGNNVEYAASARCEGSIREDMSARHSARFGPGSQI